MFGYLPCLLVVLLDRVVLVEVPRPEVEVLSVLLEREVLVEVPRPVVVVPVLVLLEREVLVEEPRLVVPVLVLLEREVLVEVLRLVEPLLVLPEREELLALLRLLLVPLFVLPEREVPVVVLRLLSLREVALLLPRLPVLVAVLLPRLLSLREVAVLRLLELFPRDCWVTLGACEVERLPVNRSVVVTVLSLRLLVMRLPLREVGSFWTITFERLAVMLPVVLVGMYSYPISPWALVPVWRNPGRSLPGVKGAGGIGAGVWGLRQ